MTILVVTAAVMQGDTQPAHAFPGTTERVSVASDGTQGNAGSFFATISANGRFVAFASASSNLVAGDTNALTDVFVHDRQTGTTERVSIATDGSQGNGSSALPFISANGRFVAYFSLASNLVAGDTNGAYDVFVHDRQTGTTERVSVASDGTQGNDESRFATMSGDGRFVAFYSLASNLVAGDTNGAYDVFVRDRQTGTTERESVASDGTEGNAGSSVAVITADGRFVAFESDATNLAVGDANGARDVFVHDRQTGTTERVSVASDGTEGNAGSYIGVIGGDGRVVAFYSLASNLVAGDTNGAYDVFVHDRQTGTTERVSVASDGTEGNSSSFIGVISGDGRVVAFYSASSNLVAGDNNGTDDVFVHDRQTGTTERVSVASDGTEADAASHIATVSGDGRFVAFYSLASNLVAGDSNAVSDVFVRDRGTVTPPPESTNGGRALNPNSPISNDPINLATGNYTYQTTDVAVSGKGLPLAFARSYNSVAVADGRLGYGWQDNLNARLEFDDPDHSIANVTVVQEQGRHDAYERFPDGTYYPPPGVFHELTRDPGDGSFDLRGKDRSVLHFDSDGVLQSMEDRNGSTTTLAYDGFNRLVTVTDPSARTLTIAYDGNDRIQTVTDPLSRVWTYAYDVNGDLVSVTDPEGQTSSYTYDAAHQMLTITDPRGNTVMTNVYDAQGRVAQQTNANGDTWAFSYGIGQTTETDPRGCATVYEYDFRYRETQRTDCPGGVTAYTYDAYGSRDSVTDALGRTTTMTYDSRGNLLSVTDALGNSTSFTYSMEDDLLSKADPLGRTTTYTYDANGNLLTATNDLGGVTTFTYDGQGQLLTATDPRGKTSSFSYDANGYQDSATDPLANATSFSYDAGGRLLSQIDPLANVTTFAYDGGDRLQTVTDPLTNTTTYAYDANGNRASVTDANLKVTSYTYDVMNRLATVTDAELGVVTYGYDSVGNRTSMTDGNLHTTTYAYDLLNRLTSVTDPEGNVTGYTYDAVGNRLTRTDGNGVTTQYAYDALNRLTRITYPDQPQVRFTYGVLGNRLTVSDLTGTTSYAYDALYRLTSVVNPGGATVSYGYDAAGNRTSLTYPDGKTVDYTYDDASRLDTVTDWDSRLTEYTYDPASRLTGTDLANGVHTARAYDDANRLTEIAHTNGPTNLITVGYTVDAVGDRSDRTETVGAGSPLTDVYGYDDLYRLTSVDYGEPTYDDQVYVYDPMGNRSQLTEGVSVTNYTYDDADRLLTAGATSYGFDANGNQALEASRTFSYDRENRLTQVADWTSSPDGVCADTNWDGTVNAGDLLAVANAFGTRAGSDAYEPVEDPRHDGVLNAGDLLLTADKLLQQCQVITASAYSGGLRMYRSEQGATERYAWDLAAALPVILQDTAGKTYSYGVELLLEETAGTPSYYLQDGLGSTIGVADVAGAAVSNYAYDAYGVARGSLQNLGYSGEQHDQAQIYLRARSYDPKTGRFLTRDPVPGFDTDSQSLTPFAYARSNPVRLTDPAGTWWWSPCWWGWFFCNDEEPAPEPEPTCESQYREDDDGTKYMRCKNLERTEKQGYGLNLDTPETFAAAALFSFSSLSPTGLSRPVEKLEPQFAGPAPPATSAVLGSASMETAGESAK